MSLSEIDIYQRHNDRLARDEAIVRQERGTPVLILDAGGVKVQA